MVRDGSTPCNNGLFVRSKPAPSSVMIGSPTIYPNYGLSESMKFGKRQQSNSLNEVRNAQKLDTSVDINFPDDQDYASPFSKVIGCKLSHGSSNDLYSLCRKKF